MEQKGSPESHPCSTRQLTYDFGLARPGKRTIFFKNSCYNYFCPALTDMLIKINLSLWKLITVNCSRCSCCLTQKQWNFTFKISPHGQNSIIQRIAQEQKTQFQDIHFSRCNILPHFFHTKLTFCIFRRLDSAIRKVNEVPATTTADRPRKLSRTFWKILHQMDVSSSPLFNFIHYWLLDIVENEMWIITRRMVRV